MSNEPFNCTSCDSVSAPGTHISGLQGSEAYRVYQCPSCGHVDLGQISASSATDPEAEGDTPASETYSA